MAKYFGVAYTKKATRKGVGKIVEKSGKARENVETFCEHFFVVVVVVEVLRVHLRRLEEVEGGGIACRICI